MIQKFACCTLLIRTDGGLETLLLSSSPTLRIQPVLGLHAYQGTDKNEGSPKHKGDNGPASKSDGQYIKGLRLVSWAMSTTLV